MDARSTIKFKRIANHLKVCIRAREHGRWYWENGEVIRFQIDFGRPLTRHELEIRIDQQRKMLKALTSVPA